MQTYQWVGQLRFYPYKVPYLVKKTADHLVRNTRVEFKQIAECDCIAAILLQNTKWSDDVTQLNHFVTDVDTSLFPT